MNRTPRGSCRRRIWSVKRSEFGLILILVTDLSGEGSGMRLNRGLEREAFMRQHQQGMTFLGLLCVLALAGVVVYAGIRLAPLYLNYMKVVKTMEAAAAEYKSDSGDLAGVTRSLDRHWNIEDITGVDYKQIEIT